MAFGAKDSRGIYQFGEDDAEATFSQLLNLGMESVSDATKFFSGTPAERASLDPAPDGAWWEDTDSARRLWRGRNGAWEIVRESGTPTAINGAAFVGTPSLTKDPFKLVTLECIVSKPGGWVNAQRVVGIPVGFRPSSFNPFPAASYGASSPAFALVELLDSGANLAVSRTPALAAADLVSIRATWVSSS